MQVKFKCFWGEKHLTAKTNITKDGGMKNEIEHEIETNFQHVLGTVNGMFGDYDFAKDSTGS